MTDLLVDRMYVRATAAGPDDEARLRRLLADLTTRRLDEALTEVIPAEGHWCLRRVEVALPYDAAAADAAISRHWARAVADALTARLTSPVAAGPDVVHYPRPLAARTDLVAELALGRTQREWAWRSVGVLTGTDPRPGTDPAEAALTVLTADPSAAVPVLVGAVQRAGLAAVHRLLGEHGWAKLAAVVLDAHGVGRGVGHRIGQGVGGGVGQGVSRERPERAPTTHADLDGAPGRAGTRSTAADPRATVTAVLARSTLAEAWRTGRVRPVPATARAWAALAVAEAEPATLRRPDLDAVLDQVAAALGSPAGDDLPRTSPSGPHAPQEVPHEGHSPDDGGQPETPGTKCAAAGTPRPGPPGPRPSGTDHGLDHTHSDEDRADHDRAHGSAAASPTPPRPGPPLDPWPTDPDRPDLGDPVPVPAPTLHPTAWGGLVYLLATATEAGVPDDLLDDDRLRDRSASWLLFQLLRLLIGPAPDAATDPTVRVLAGLAPDAAVPEPEPTPVELDPLLEHAVTWARVTADRLDGDGAPRELIRRLAARVGSVESVPGWTEVRLALDDVDLAVRRAGLDLDPGFVPWLGAVVVIRYV